MSMLKSPVIYYLFDSVCIMWSVLVNSLINNVRSSITDGLLYTLPIIKCILFSFMIMMNLTQIFVDLRI